MPSSAFRPKVAATPSVSRRIDRGRPAHLLEKDVWAVWALAALYQSALREHLVFKGGTSLSKAYGVIRRFSEDVDLTYDIRVIAPDLVGADGEALPKTRSEEKRWSSEVRRRLPEWVTGTAQPVIASAWAAERLAASISKARSCSSTMRRRRPARALSRRARRSSSVPARRASPRVCAMSPATRPV
jgi:hypothetical protein